MSARIASAQLARYVAPGRALTRPHGLVVRLMLTGLAEPVTGVGEAVVAGDRTEPAWQALSEIAAAVVGARLPAEVDPARPLAGIAGWRPVTGTDRGPRRSAKLAVELALLDALGKARGGPVWPTEAGRLPAEPPPVYVLPKLPPDAPLDELTGTLRAEPGRAWALRLRLTGEDALDLAWLARAVEIELAAGRHRPVWLVGGGRERAAGASFVAALAAALPAGCELLLEEPLRSGPESALAKVRQRSILARLPARSPLRELQQVADRALGHSGTGPRRLSIVAGESLVSAAQAATLAGAVGGLHLSLTRFGTLVGLRGAAQAARQANPAVRVLLAGERGSRITTNALAMLHAATPAVDEYLPVPLPSGWPVLRSEPAAEVDLAELAAVADALASVPATPPPPDAPRPNRFPDYPLTGAALAVRSMLLETEALRVGLRTRRLARDFFLVEHPDTGQGSGFFDSEPSGTSVAASVSAADKGVTRALLAQAGLPVPAGGSYPAGDAGREQAYAAGLALGFPLVVKPAGGSKGTAVTVGIASPTELAKAIEEVAGSKYAETGIVVERFVTGDDYRVLATRQELLSVVRREPASVVGDGRRSIEELVLAANVARRHNPHLAKRLITLDSRVDDQLARQGLARRAVPTTGQRVRLRVEANLSLGGDSREVLDETHPSLRELATAAVAAIPGLPYAGLDILLADHRRPVADQPAFLIEVNSRPVQSLHHFPMYGPPRNVSTALLAEAVRSAGWQVPTPVDRLTVRVSVTGRLAGAGYRRWLSELATQLGLAGWVGHRDAGQVEVLAHGPAPRVGLLLRSAFHGPAAAGVTETYAEPVATVPPAGFRVRGGRRG